ncbi:MAG TPA: hypothetical protein VG916_00920 [Gemmatimonadaceae bacterium]|nr:hypothetical protein [Gemmatimonadaceae bacterium]
MPKPRPTPAPRAVREPVQVYLAPDDSELLARLVNESGLSKAEVLRRGMRSFAREQGGESPMLKFVSDGASGRWPDHVAARHDDVLAESYRGTRKRSR